MHVEWAAVHESGYYHNDSSGMHIILFYNIISLTLHVLTSNALLCRYLPYTTVLFTIYSVRNSNRVTMTSALQDNTCLLYTSRCV